MKTTIDDQEKLHQKHRVRYDRVEQILEGVLGGGLEGNFWAVGPSLCVHSKVKCLHGWCAQNILWQLFPVWDYSDAERMLATTSLTTLLVNLQSMTSKPNAGGSSKDCVTWKVEEAVHNFVHAVKVTMDSSTD